MQPAEILQIPRSPLEKVYECIVNDLTDASALPAKGDYSEDDAYRATRGFAKTMLAKTYMFKGDFTSAETVLHDIIEVDKDYTLLSDYGMNWRTEYENSSESVFEIANKVYDKKHSHRYQCPSLLHKQTYLRLSRIWISRTNPRSP